MAKDKKQFSGQKWLVGIVIIFLALCAGAMLYLIKSLPGGLLPGEVSSVPIPLNSGTPIPVGQRGSIGASGTVKGVDFSMSVKVSEGRELPQPFVPLPLATGIPLDAGQIDQILSRLPTLMPAAQSDFNLPQDPLPPPRPGQTVKDNFPPLEIAPTPDVAAAGLLEVLRFAPEGEIPIAPFVSVTFNQAMVPLGTLADLAAKDVPVLIEPALPGTWRWLGTKTLTFEYDSELIDRLPKATAYKVTVPAGTKSVNGGVLGADVTWRFTTPAPKVISVYPSGSPQPLTPLFFVAFDQRVNPAEVLKTIRVQAGSRSAALALASDEEIQKDEQVSQMVKSAVAGRWLAFRALEAFPTETNITLTIGPGTPSAEGPLLTAEAQSSNFSTYAPLRIEEHRCSWYDDTCPPLTPFSIRFNNPLDMTLFNESMLRVTPAIPGVNANVYGDTIEIQGQTKGQTTYTVTLSGQIQDIFGQRLGQDAALTFKVGKADSVLVGPGQNFITLDPQSVKPVFSVYAINYSRLHTSIYAVQPADWPAYKNYLQNWQRTDIPSTMPGTLLSDESINPNLPADTLTQVDIDLSKHLRGSFGHFVVVVEPPSGLLESNDARYRRFSQTVIAWVQVTQIGLDAVNDYSQMVAWANSLKDGTPLAGVSIQPGSGAQTTTTGADGIARFDLPTGANYLVARLGDDQAILPHSNYVWGDDPWSSTPPSDSLRWYVFDDRAMYRPGEEVHVKGWMRRIGGGQDGDVGLLGGLAQQVSYVITDATGNAIDNGQADVNALDGFDFSFSIPQTINLGSAQIQLTAIGNLSGTDGVSWYHAFQVQEFRRPEFEVTARNESSGPYFVGGSAILAVEAKYYAGGTLPNAEVTWNVTSAPGNYAPPNWPDFTFGTWTPWWYFYDRGFPPEGNPGTTETFTGKTDASGTHFLQLDFTQQGQPDQNPRPLSVSAEATVMDVNRQAWTSRTNLLVHPADVYIGLRSERYFVELGQPLKIEFIVPDLDGNAVAGRPVTMTAARLEWKFRAGEWHEDALETQTCSMTSASDPGSCSFETPIGGSYQIIASVTDAQGRINQSRLTRWVSGGKLRPSRQVEQEQVTLIPDKQTYQPGDTAQILVQSPFAPAEGLLTISRSGILSSMRFTIDASGATTLRVAIEEKHIPNLNIQVDLVGAAQRTDDQGLALTNVPPRPAYASGQLNLSIPPLSRTLSVVATPDTSKLDPGSQTTLTVTVKDADGHPVADAELAVVVVDEAILALTDYQMADPLSIFYSERPSSIETAYSRANIVLLDPVTLARDARLQKNSVSESFGGVMPAATAMAAAEAAPGARAGGQATAPIRIRSDFNPLATFAAQVRTGLDGTARLPVKLPDNLTRYRVMVVAVDTQGSKFGMGESNLTARLPLMVRPSAPRFLNFGDKFELPVVLQNQTDLPLEVSVAARASNLELFNAGMLVIIPANDRIEVRFAAGTLQAGKASLQIAAVSGSYADAAIVELPVYTPATTEAFATYGVIDDGSLSQPVQYPNGVFAQYGGLEISTSSTALQSLTDAVLYLVTYPYECSEQLASRILAVAALRDVLTAFKAEGLPAPAEMESAVNQDIERLQGMQNPDGGFPYWRRGFDSNPFNSIHVAHALYRAEQKGFSVPADMRANALSYLQQIENYYPSWYGAQTRRTLSAYALYVRNLMGDRDAPKAQKLLNEGGLDGLSLDAIGWLWPLIEDPGQLESLRRYIGNHVVETPGAANFTNAYDDQTYLLLSSDRRTDAILLDALISDNPQSDLIPKLVTGLLAHKTKGRWDNTQENVFVLLALDKYFNTFESQTPDFVARIWLGNTYAGSSEFRGRSTDLHETKIPMNYVLSETAAGGGTQALILEKDGAGRLYYRLGLRYAPTDLNLPALDMGFVVQRRYEALDTPEDVSQDSSGVWHIKAGARVRVHLTMAADNRRYHVALVDPLPAGLEIVNPALATSGSVPQDPGSSSSKYGWWWWSTWYEHQNMRDERAEAFTSLLWEGVYEYTYIARATTPGSFVVPPAKAEEMYSPEVFGRSGSDQVIIK